MTISRSRQLVEDHPNFNVHEFKNVDRLNPMILRLIFNLREWLGLSMHIHSDFRQGDSGQHGKGNAIDFSIRSIPYSQAILRLEEWLKRPAEIDGEIILPETYCGFGLYPYWNNPGFHLDCRGARGRWAFDNSSPVKMISYQQGRDIAFARVAKQG